MKDIFFKQYWQKQTSPLTCIDDSMDISSLYAGEINILLKKISYDGGTCYETGCGNGALFNFLDINKVNYKGVDLSDSMVNQFKQKHPGVNVTVGNGVKLDYEPDKYSLIFNTGVVQYFSPDELTAYLVSAKDNLNANGKILLVNVLHKKSRSLFFSSYFSGKKFSLLQSLKLKILGLISPLKIHSNAKVMGYWYDVKYFNKVANHLGLTAEYYGSILQPFRISVVLKKS